MGLTWMLMAAAMIAVAATGGWYFVRRNVRHLMNDEATVATRYKSNSLGFINAMLTAVLLYGLTFAKHFSVREALVVIFAVGMSSALLSFGVWERRALADG